MKVGNQIVNGMFEYMDNLEYTENDLVFRTYVNSENQTVRRIFKVLTDVVGVKPELDLSETYYRDYFKYEYTSLGILTETALDNYLRLNFPGIRNGGVFEPEDIAIERVSSINRSGIWHVNSTGEYVITYISLPTSFMLIYNDSESTSEPSISFRIGDTTSVDEEINVNWGVTHLVSGNVDRIVSQHITSLTSLEILLRDRITQFDDLISGLNTQ